MKVAIATVLVCAVGVLAGCGERAAEAPVALPRSGTAYRALNAGERLAVAGACRDRAAARAGRTAASELRRLDPGALRAQLDAAFRVVRNQPRPVAELCAEHLPFVTPGLTVRFDGAKDSGDAFTYETDSDVPLTIRGAVSPAPRSGEVVVRREFGSSPALRSRIGADGQFVLPTVRLRKLANNSFIVTIHAPPHAVRKVYFSAICLDCLAGSQPPGAG
jgi:hypothetical protein